jgi:hypothetical protein
MSDKLTIQLPLSRIVRSYVRQQRDKSMNPVSVFVIELVNRDVYELHGNWQSALAGDGDSTRLTITDDLDADWLVIRKRNVKKVAKPWYTNFDPGYPHPFEFANITIDGKKHSLITYVLRVNEDTRIYQLEDESGTSFFKRIRKVLDGPFNV